MLIYSSYEKKKSTRLVCVSIFLLFPIRVTFLMPENDSVGVAMNDSIGSAIEIKMAKKVVQNLAINEKRVRFCLYVRIWS